MRKLFVFIAVIFSFVLGLAKTEAVAYVSLPNEPTEIIAVEENSYNAVNNITDKYFISNNVQNSVEYIFENLGSAENDDFNINNLFVSLKQNFKLNTGVNEYLLSNSFNPRAP